ncbi:hypothetical protein DVR12_06605 [Chitinophaga silvatica]|uniref:Uncharacterized protein n=1 Tax=Chitinophaga silvatica TaxID=2282649 RepID=A0A3E1YEA0_9BACT|nr:hypothetical protein [Chitinophaga silvatica]RFS24856.1 hypothetical protein DVR12_06605 [Chitinophaga silvatica]
MTSQEYVENKLSEAVKLFPQIHCRQEHDIHSEIHFIEVTPASYFKKDISFKEWRKKTFFEFISLYPEGLCFFPKERRKHIIENCEFEIQGSLYKSRKKVTTQLANL